MREGGRTRTFAGARLRLRLILRMQLCMYAVLLAFRAARFTSHT